MADVVIRGMEMPSSCDMCWALDDCGDYPRCRITEEQRGYNFQIREKRMDNCPLIFAQETQEQKEQASPQADAEWSELMEDLDAAETLCCQTESLPDIFPTRVIRTICKLQYRALMREAKRLKRRRQDYDQR